MKTDRALLPVSAGAIITDADGRVLIVNPTYKPYWNLPGGHVDPAELPSAACQREIREEIGLELDVGALLVHAYLAAPGRSPHAYYIFDAGELTEVQRRSIRLQASELSEYRFAAPEHLGPHEIPPGLSPLWRAALTAREQRLPAYLEVGPQ